MSKVKYQPKKKTDNFIDWVCPICGHSILSKDRPESITWTDGHICNFVSGIDKKEGLRRGIEIEL